jgi:hypothetical protein
MTRGRLSALTLTVLLAMLVAAAYVGWRSLTAPLPTDGSTDAATPTCTSQLERGDVVQSGEVTVSVYNAGTRSGLAGETRDALVDRGFIAGDVGNAPGDLADVEGALVLAPSANDPAARLVARQLGRDVEVRPSDDQLGPGVEVVVGDSFDGLVKAPVQLRAKASGSGC